jgi:hypothetical protein
MAFDDSAPVTIYADEALNNFAISGVDLAVSSDPDYQFAYLNDPANEVNEAVISNSLKLDTFGPTGDNPCPLASDLPGDGGCSMCQRLWLRSVSQS